MKWELGFSHEASNYAIDSHPYNEKVLMAIEELAFSAEGIPDEHYTELEPNIYLWEVAEYLVLYQRIVENRQRLWIAFIKPR